MLICAETKKEIQRPDVVGGKGPTDIECEMTEICGVS